MPNNGMAGICPIAEMVENLFYKNTRPNVVKTINAVRMLLRVLSHEHEVHCGRKLPLPGYVHAAHWKVGTAGNEAFAEIMLNRRKSFRSKLRLAIEIGNIRP